jgi:hypothetical protein
MMLNNSEEIRPFAGMQRAFVSSLKLGNYERMSVF